MVRERTVNNGALTDWPFRRGRSERREEIDAAGLDDWRTLAQALHGRWATDGLSRAAAFLAECDQSADHILEVRLRSSWIELRLATYEGRWLVTAADVAAARRISDIAGRRGLRPEPSAVLQVEIGLDSAHIPLEGPFWSVLLNGHTNNFDHGEVVDADSDAPSFTVLADTDGNTVCVCTYLGR